MLLTVIADDNLPGLRTPSRLFDLPHPYIYLPRQRTRAHAGHGSLGRPPGTFHSSLFNHSRRLNAQMAVILLTTGFAVSVTATLICFAKTLIVVLRASPLYVPFPTSLTDCDTATFIWEPFVNICAPQKTSRMLMAGWGCAMAYELLVLCATCWNAFDRPRTAQQPILRTLAQDGIYYFSSITICRVLTLALAATGKPHLAFIAI